MYMEIYADVVFLINLIMDYFIFWIVNKLSKRKARRKRLFFGAFIAAVLYCGMIFLPYTTVFMNVIFSMAVLMLGIVAAFKPKSVKEFFKLILLAHISAFAVGGLVSALFFYTNITGHIGNLIGFTIGNFSVKLLLTATCISYVAIKLASGFITKVFIHKQSFCPVKIFYNDRKVMFNALVDTGNSLRDPATNSPVLIVEFNKLTDILPDVIKLIFYEHKENDINSLMNISDDFVASRIRMIPFNSLGKQNGILIGFRPDKVVISNDKDIVRSDVIVGIYNNILSRDGTYSGLLSPLMLAESEAGSV